MPLLDRRRISRRPWWRLDTVAGIGVTSGQPRLLPQSRMYLSPEEPRRLSLHHVDFDEELFYLVLSKFQQAMTPEMAQIRLYKLVTSSCGKVMRERISSLERFLMLLKLYPQFEVDELKVRWNINQPLYRRRLESSLPNSDEETDVIEPYDIVQEAAANAFLVAVFRQSKRRRLHVRKIVQLLLFQ
ncbi:unnamed protein product [Soboliphyme baturini]|uniref:CDT1 domain-containing protein n=1 Tax=Soboliphyme baturini TaxID=241478 RepID=A0A183IAL0_9BILA|nr:unnamed protein product [Soboliphyme baturini]